MKKHMCIVVISGVLLMAGMVTESSAWDGERKGFILGTGLGTGFTSVNQEVVLGPASVSNRMNKLPISGNFKIGFAPNNRWAIYFVEKDNFFKEGCCWFASSLRGLGASYFLRESAKSAFISGGVGLGGFGVWEDNKIKGTDGFGLFAGVGYEFSKHWSIEGDLNIDIASEENQGIELSTNVIAFMITLNVLGY